MWGFLMPWKKRLKARRARVEIVIAGAMAASLLAGTPANAAPATFSATQTIPVPPASNFTAPGGGDGWSVAMTPDSVFNVFHHNGNVVVACHKQSDASPCYTPKVVLDGA